MKGDVDGQGAQMTFMEHLLELRTRLVCCALCIVICMAMAAFFYKPLYGLITRPMFRLNDMYEQQYEKEKETNPNAVKPRILALKSIDPLETIVMVMWLAVGAGLVFSSPVLIYQLWAFVSPGLRDKERRAIKPVLYGGIFFFLSGCALAYFLLFPVSIRFFNALNIELNVESDWTPDKYSSLLFNLMAICGLLCETPLVVAALAKVGLLKPSHLTRYWRLCILGSFIFGAAFSPGTDVMSMMLFSGLLLSLYILSIMMAHIFYPKGQE